MEVKTFDRYRQVWKKLLRYILRTVSDSDLFSLTAAQETAPETMLEQCRDAMTAGEAESDGQESPSTTS